MLRYEFIDPDLQISSPDFQFIESFLKATDRTQIGWHYITDITWIYSQLKDWPRDFKVLDAGGGGGPVQFLMAELSFDVTNCDLCASVPPISYQKRYRCAYQILPSFKNTNYKDFLETLCREYKVWTSGRVDVKNMIKKLWPYKWWSAKRYAQKHEQWRQEQRLTNTRIGRLQWLAANLCHMPEVPANTFDAVVSLSALEHIPFEALQAALDEIKRVLKPSARWAVTTSGTEKAETWFHESSQGNCFSYADFENIFVARPEGEQNPAEILQKYQDCGYLKENLAKFYFKSGKYGMPWGKWSPKYIPVGIFK